MVIYLLLAILSASWGQDAEPALEKGIYAEEILGDLDAAIAIYTEIATDFKRGRHIRAQALFHQGSCYYKKGMPSHGLVSLTQLVTEFPEEKALIERAQALLPEELRSVARTPIPWKDNECLVYREHLPPDKAISGIMVTTANRVLGDQGEIWRTRLHRHMGIYPTRAVVDADLEDYHPIKVSGYRVDGALIKVFAGPESLEVETVIDGKSTRRTIETGRSVFSYLQAWQVVRTIPQIPGKVFYYPFYSEWMGLVLDLDLTFREPEQVVVPAGRFECVRGVTSQGLLTFWVSTQPPHYIVKINILGTISELSQIMERDPTRPMTVSDKHFSLTLPPLWFHYTREPDSANKTRIDLLPPQFQCKAQLVFSDHGTEEAGETDFQAGGLSMKRLIEIREKDNRRAVFTLEAPKDRYSEIKPQFSEIIKSLSW